jgi:hypothetical protein
MKRATLFSGLLLLFAACKNEEPKVPDNLLDRQTFTAVMLDAQLVEGFKTQIAHSAAKGRNVGRHLYLDIFEKHGVSEKDFRRTYGYYQERPELMEGIYEQVLDSLSKLEAQIKKDFSDQTKLQHDSLSRPYKVPRDSTKMNPFKAAQHGNYKPSMKGL